VAKTNPEVVGINSHFKAVEMAMREIESTPTKNEIISSQN
jgi:hypothetical protein